MARQCSFGHYYRYIDVVSALLVWVFIRYNRKANPTPSSTTHNTPIEILWTIIPVFILIGIGVISLPILLKQLRIPDSDVVIKATGGSVVLVLRLPAAQFFI